MKNTLVILLIFSSLILQSQNKKQEFSGIVEYQIINNQHFSKNWYKNELTQKIVYYNKGKVRIDEYIDDIRVKSIYSYPDSNYSFLLNACGNYIFKIKPNNDNIPNTSVETTHVSTTVCGYQSSAIRFLNDELIYYSKDIPISNVNLFVDNLKYKNATILRKYLYLKIIGKDFNDKLLYLEEAKSIKWTNLPDSIFSLPQTDSTFQPNRKLSLSGIAEELMHCQDYKKAIHLYTKTLQEDATLDNVRYNRVLCNLKLKENIEACKDLYILKNLKFKKTKGTYSSICSCEALYPFYLEELQKNIKNKDYNKAIETFRIIINCENADTSVAFKNAIKKAKNNQEIEAYKDLLSINNKENSTEEINKYEFLKAYLKKADQAYKNKKYTQAIKFYSIVINSFPDSKSAFRKRGKSFIKIKDKEKACRDFNQSILLGDEESKKLAKRYCK